MPAWFGQRESANEKPNPFVPGQGAVPPFLAGREAEQRLINDRLDRLASKAQPSSFVILHGPRGNGKTALLEWAERQARSRKIRVIDIELGESEATGTEVRELWRISKWLKAVSGISIQGTGIIRREVPPSKLTAAIERRAHRGPVLVGIDEAHTMPVSVGRNLLTAGQRWQRQGLPAMLFLAGTPDLPEHLRKMGASFWERSKQLPIGRLARRASQDAVRIPLEERGRSIAADALRRIAEESHGYPFFLQLWGELLWKECRDTARQLNCMDVDRVRPEFQQDKNRFYLTRYWELRTAKLLEVAAAVSESFRGSERMPIGHLEAAVGSALRLVGRPCDENAVQAACRELHNLGYIWRVEHEGRPCYEPGIPSLMAYVARAVDSEAQPRPS